ncbi:hypothetical protein CTM88_02390 [Photobacterium aquimaris]|uniref:Restriction endonuclease n=1 Tax=Photobacterium aquimaris TaxID=512643 RepID=A0A2T3IRZ0_9GAMM|nr:hypothetical protein [Photobacterium aquimaris]PSU31107.1 hypothetical protein CTM88_02390 [Photobacterium aquimaris]
MNQHSQNYSMAQIQHLLANDPQTQDFFERKTVSTYEEFVRVLHKDILRAITDVQHDRHLFQDASFGEDAISTVIIKCLKFMNYDAEHDTQHGGHCDILVKHQALGFEWIGEAKLWKGQAYVKGGLEQLLTRYATGTTGESAGGLLVYVKQENALEKLITWHTELSSHNSTHSIEDLPERPRKLYFDSVQLAQASGLDYDMRTFFVALNHATSIEPEYEHDGTIVSA